MNNDKLISALQRHKKDFSTLIPSLRQSQTKPLDLSQDSKLLEGIDLKNTPLFHKRLFDEILRGKAGIGGYFENRAIYRRSAHYDGTEARSLHLGLDIWMPSGTSVHSPLQGVIHSLQDNAGFGNYGPTIVVEHQIDSEAFFLLHGHLDVASLDLWNPGDPIKKGQLVGNIGDFPENGDWPPHLHLQLIRDMLGHSGDFPGVAPPSMRSYYLQYCLDPDYILVFND